MRRGLRDESRYRLGHDTPLLRASSTLDQHREVQLLARESFQRVLADSPEFFLAHWALQPIFEVGVPMSPA